MIVKEKDGDDPFIQQAQIFKLLTHPARLAILAILRDGEHCVCHLEAYLGFRQAYISQQLAVLREAGLISDRRDGWNIFYRAADTRVYAILDSVKQITDTQTELSFLNKVECTCPHCSGEIGQSKKHSGDES